MVLTFVTFMHCGGTINLNVVIDLLSEHHVQVEYTLLLKQSVAIAHSGNIFKDQSCHRTTPGGGDTYECVCLVAVKLFCNMFSLSSSQVLKHSKYSDQYVFFLYMIP